MTGYYSHYKMLEEVLLQRTYLRPEKTWRVFLCWHPYVICAILSILVFQLFTKCFSMSHLKVLAPLYVSFHSHTWNTFLYIPLCIMINLHAFVFCLCFYFSHLTLSYKSCYQLTFLCSTLPWKSSHLKIIIAFHFSLNVNIPFPLKLLLTGCFIIATGNEIKTMFIGIEIIFSLQGLAKLRMKTFHFSNCCFLISLGI